MLAQVQPLDTPEVQWSLLIPVLIAIGGALVLMLLGALTPRRPKLAWHAPFALAVATAAGVASVFQWFRVRDDGPQFVVAEAVRVDALGAYLGILQLLAARSSDGDGASPAPVAMGQAGGHERPPS